LASATTGYDSISATTQLFVSDGTTAGTIKVTSFPHSLYPSKLYSFQNKLIMTGGDTLSGEEELFASDGTAAGTVCPTPPSTWGQYPFYPWEAWVPFNNALYYKGAYAYFADYQLCRYTETQPLGIVTDKEFPKAFVLFQNYPNPFNPSTSISFTLSSKSFVSLKVFDALGREVSVLLSEELPAGTYARQWNGSNLPSGVYFYRLQADKFTETKKLILLK
jgi:hypothetical protein